MMASSSLAAQGCLSRIRTMAGRGSLVPRPHPPTPPTHPHPLPSFHSSTPTLTHPRTHPQVALGASGGSGRRPVGGAGAGGILFIESGVDITRPETLTPELFKGVTQVSFGSRLAGLGHRGGVLGVLALSSRHPGTFGLGPTGHQAGSAARNVSPRWATGHERWPACSRWAKLLSDVGMLGG